MPALILIALVFVLPFLSWYRFWPIPDWSTDAICIFLISLGMLIHFLGSFRKKIHTVVKHVYTLEIPAIAVCGMAWLVYIQFVNYFGGGVGYSQRTLMFAFPLAASVLVYSGVRLYSRRVVLSILAIGITLGALLQCVLGFIQAVGLAPAMQHFVIYQVDFPTLNIFGNFGQRNMFAHFLCWGLISVCYLYSVRKLSAILTFPCVVILTLFMTWSMSRTVLLYSVATAVLTLFWLHRNRHDEQLIRFAKAVMWATCTMAVCQLFMETIIYCLQWVGLPIDSHLVSGASRITESGFGARRRIEWEKAWVVFRQHPWFGVGFGGFAYQSVWLESLGGYEPVVENSLFTNAHNFVMQLLAETGFVGVVLVLGGIFLCVLPFFRKSQCNVENLALLAMVMVTLSHSMLEYPLWYLPFLTGLLVFLSFSPIQSLKLIVRAYLPKGITLFLAIAGLAYTITGIQVFVNLAKWQTPTDSQAENIARIKSLETLSYNPFWAYEADSELAKYIPLNRTNLVEKQEHLERLVAYRPYPDVLVKLSILKAYSGQMEESKSLLLMLLAAYPAKVLDLHGNFQRFDDPVLLPLRDLVNQAMSIYKKDGEVATVRWAVVLQTKLHHINR